MSESDSYNDGDLSSFNSDDDEDRSPTTDEEIDNVEPPATTSRKRKASERAKEQLGVVPLSQREDDTDPEDREYIVESPDEDGNPKRARIEESHSDNDSDEDWSRQTLEQRIAQMLAGGVFYDDSEDDDGESGDESSESDGIVYLNLHEDDTEVEISDSDDEAGRIDIHESSGEEAEDEDSDDHHEDEEGEFSDDHFDDAALFESDSYDDEYRPPNSDEEIDDVISTIRPKEDEMAFLDNLSDPGSEDSSVIGPVDDLAEDDEAELYAEDSDEKNEELFNFDSDDDEVIDFEPDDDEEIIDFDSDDDEEMISYDEDKPLNSDEETNDLVSINLQKTNTLNAEQSKDNASRKDTEDVEPPATNSRKRKASERAKEQLAVVPLSQREDDTDPEDREYIVESPDEDGNPKRARIEESQSDNDSDEDWSRQTLEQRLAQMLAGGVFYDDSSESESIVYLNLHEDDIEVEISNSDDEAGRIDIHESSGEEAEDEDSDDHHEDESEDEEGEFSDDHFDDAALFESDSYDDEYRPPNSDEEIDDVISTIRPKEDEMAFLDNLSDPGSEDSSVIGPVDDLDELAEADEADLYAEDSDEGDDLGGFIAPEHVYCECEDSDEDLDEGNENVFDSDDDEEVIDFDPADDEEIIDFDSDDDENRPLNSDEEIDDLISTIRPKEDDMAFLDHYSDPGSEDSSVIGPVDDLDELAEDDEADLYAEDSDKGDDLDEFIAPEGEVDRESEDSDEDVDKGNEDVFDSDEWWR